MMPDVDLLPKWALIVEDNPDHAKLAAITLRKAIANLTEARCCDSTADALAILSSCTSLPFAVFVDVNLAGENGFAIVEWIKASPRLAQTKVVVLTSLGDDWARTEALLAGADAFACKPLNLERALCFYEAQTIRWDLSELPDDLTEYRARIRAKH